MCSLIHGTHTSATDGAKPSQGYPGACWDWVDKWVPDKVLNSSQVRVTAVSYHADFSGEGESYGFADVSGECCMYTWAAVMAFEGWHQVRFEYVPKAPNQG